MWAMKKLGHLFYGIKFDFYTDHQPLMGLLILPEKVPKYNGWSIS